VLSTTSRSVLWIGMAALLGACNDTGSGTPTGLESATSVPGAPLGQSSSNACNPQRGHPAGKIIQSMAAPSPWAVAVRDDGLTYFTEIFNNQVGITNTFTRTISGTIPSGSLPTGLAFSPDGTRAYTANQGDNSVTVIDVGTGQVVGSVSTGFSAPSSAQVSPDGSQVYVGNNDNSLMIVDAQTLQITKTLTVGFATNAFAVDPAGRMLYASHFASGSVSEIDIFTGNVLRTFQLGGTTQGLALNRKGTHLYIANEGGYLSDVDLVNGTFGAQIPLAGVGFGVGVTPDDTEAWITLPLEGKVQVFNLAQRRITGTLQVGGEPRRIAFSAQGKIGALTDPSGFIIFVR
jgi:YVTN family beta-propeller protein